MTQPIDQFSLDQPGRDQGPAGLPDPPFLPDAYRLPEGARRGPLGPAGPRVIFIEVTNRCNLRCQTCIRTFHTREPLKSLSLDEFVAIADQFPAMARALLHGIGEPLLNRHLPSMIRHLKARQVEVVINSNGTRLSPRWQAALVQSELDAFRCSIDGASRATYARIRGADLLDRVVAGLSGLAQTRARLGAGRPHLSIWCVVTAENLAELPDLVRLAARLGVDELYLQRMVYFQEPEQQVGMMTAEMALFERAHAQQEEVLAACEALGRELGIALRASGARDPRGSLAAARPDQATPWQACLRPWTTAYVTANGNCLPCCIAPFSTADYESLILGNLFQRPFAEIWDGPRYQAFRAALLDGGEPHRACIGCGVHWSL